MSNIVIVAVVAVILIAAARYVYKAKKRGAKCIGCSAGVNGCCSCGGESVKESSSCCCQEK